MRIDEINIDGFGLFRKLRIDRLSPGTNLIYGRNESGKSTLLGFIRAILFGFPDGRSKSNTYPPLSGGRHGGNITLQNRDQQKYIIERFAGKKGGNLTVIKPDQTKGDSLFLDNLLGGVSQSLFDNVFAFSLSELQNFATLNTDSIKGALYSAGAGIDLGNLASLTKQIEKKETELFRPRGKKTINRLLSRLNNIAKEKKEVQGAIAEYDEFKSKITVHEQRIKTFKDKNRQLSFKLRTREEWINSWPDWIGFTSAKEKLLEQESIDSFPYQGIQRYEKLKDKLETNTIALDEKLSELERQKADLSRLKINYSLLKEDPSIVLIQKDIGRFESVLKDIGLNDREIENSYRQLKDSLIKLGPQWDEEKIGSYNISIETREEIRHFRDAIQKAETVESYAKQALDNIGSRIDQANAQMQVLQEPSIKNPGLLSEMGIAGRDVLRLKQQFDILKTESNNTSQRIYDLEAQIDIFNKMTDTRAFNYLLWGMAIMFGMAIIGSVWFGMKEQWLQAGSIGGFFVFCGLSLLIFRISSKKKQDLKNRELETHIIPLEKSRKELADKDIDIQSEIETTLGKINKACQKLNLPDIPSGEELDRIVQDISEQSRSLDLWASAETALNDLKKNKELIESKFIDAETRSGEVKTQWEIWLENHDLSALLTPDGALETLAFISSSKTHSNRLNQLRSKGKDLILERDEYIDLLNTVLTVIGDEPVSDELSHKDSIPLTVSKLVKRFSETQEAFHKSTLLTNEIESSQITANRLEKDHNKLQSEIKELLHTAGAENEEKFMEMGMLYEKQQALKEERDTHETRLKTVSKENNEIFELFPDLSIKIIEEERQRFEQELEESNTELEELTREHAKLEERIDQLQNDEKISKLRAEEESLKSSLETLAEEWAVFHTAGTLIRMAREKYERDRQPQVIMEAGQFFKDFTSERYSSILAPLQKNSIEVINRENSRKEIEQLSRGTAEQLYLSLRFGFIRELSSKSASLPIIMDETLVNFDEPRALAAIQAIKKLSSNHQVLFFTCHPYTVELFKISDPGLQVIEIEDGKVIK